jgi:hypothetical protein
MMHCLKETSLHCNKESFLGLKAFRLSALSCSLLCSILGVNKTMGTEFVVGGNCSRRGHNVVGDDNGGCVKLFGVYLETQRDGNSIKKSLSAGNIASKDVDNNGKGVHRCLSDGPTRRKTKTALERKGIYLDSLYFSL